MTATYNEKGDRYVRTLEGAEKYGQPIGSLIVAGPSVRLEGVPGKIDRADPNLHEPYDDRNEWCYQHAAQYAIHNSEPDTPGMFLVHGYVQISPNLPAINHSWVELPDGDVFEPNTGHRMSKGDFESFFNPTNSVRYDASEMRQQLMKHRNWGPWNGGIRVSEVLARGVRGILRAGSRLAGKSVEELMELKRIRRVRTAAGAKKYGQPIGSIIVRDGAPPLTHITLGDTKYDDGAEQLLGSDGNTYVMFLDDVDGSYTVLAERDYWDDYVVRWAESPEEALELLDKAVGAGRKRKSPALYGSMSGLDDEEEDRDLRKDLDKRAAKLKPYTDKRRKTFDRETAAHLKNYAEETDAETAEQWIEHAEARVAHLEALQENRAAAMAKQKAKEQQQVAREKAGPFLPGNYVAITEGAHKGKSGVVQQVGAATITVRIEGESRDRRVPHGHAQQSSPQMEQHNRDVEARFNKKFKQAKDRAAKIKKTVGEDADATDPLSKVEAFEQHMARVEDMSPSQKLKELEIAQLNLDEAEKILNYRRTAGSVVPETAQKYGEILERFTDSTGTDWMLLSDGKAMANRQRVSIMGYEQARSKHVQLEGGRVERHASVDFSKVPWEKIPLDFRSIDPSGQKHVMNFGPHGSTKVPWSGPEKEPVEQPSVVKDSPYRDYEGTVGALLMTGQQKATLRRLIEQMEQRRDTQAAETLKALRNQVAKDGARPGIVTKFRMLEKEIERINKEHFKPKKIVSSAPKVPNSTQNKPIIEVRPARSTDKEGADIRVTDEVQIGSGKASYRIVAIHDDNTLELVDTATNRHRKAEANTVRRVVEGTDASRQRDSESLPAEAPAMPSRKNRKPHTTDATNATTLGATTNLVMSPAVADEMYFMFETYDNDPVRAGYSLSGATSRLITIYDKVRTLEVIDDLIEFAEEQEKRPLRTSLVKWRNKVRAEV